MTDQKNTSKRLRGNKKTAVAPVGFVPSSSLLLNQGKGLVAGTVSDNTGLMLLGRYEAGPVKFYAGYEDILFANPHFPLSAGTTIIGGYSLGTVSNTAFANKRDLPSVLDRRKICRHFRSRSDGRLLPRATEQLLWQWLLGCIADELQRTIERSFARGGLPFCKTLGRLCGRHVFSCGKWSRQWLP